MDGWASRSILVMGGVVLIAALPVPRLLARATLRMNNGWKKIALATAIVGAVVVVVVVVVVVAVRSDYAKG
jgi:cytochrome c oxidase subunit IV